MKKKSVLVNPFFLYSLFFLIMFFAYRLNWSFLNPILSNKLSIFVIFSSIISLVFAYFFHLLPKDQKIKNYEYRNLYSFISIGIFLGTILEGIYNKGFPILSVVGINNVSYMDFGIPTFHVFLLTISFFYVLILFEIMINKGPRKIIILNTLVGILPFIISINRGMIVMLLLCFLFLYLQYKPLKFSLKKIFTITIISIFFLYLFGIFGNYRMNSDYKQNLRSSDSTLIMTIGEATPQFRESKIPKTFFWTYSYLTSPLANLQFNINNNVSSVPIDMRKIYEYFVSVLLPDFISNRISISPVASYRIRVEMTVGTGYYQTFSRLGWAGMYIYQIVLLFLPIIYLTLLNQFARKYVFIGLALLCTVYTLTFFTNFLNYSGLMIQLAFPFFLELTNKIRWKEVD